MKIFLSPFKKQSYINIVFIVVLFLPVTSFSYFVQLVVLFWLLLTSIKLNGLRIRGGFIHQKIAFIVWVLLSLSYNGLVDNVLSLDSIIKISYLSLLIISFPFSGALYIYQRLIFISILLILLSQVSYPLQFSFITNIIDTYYARELYFNSSELLNISAYSGSILDLRFGGIYRNPNQCGRIITLLYCIFLINKKHGRESKFDGLFFLLFSSSILLTGSRTALAIFTIFTGLYGLSFIKKNIYKTIIIALIFMLIIIPFKGNFKLQSRIFDFTELTGLESNSSFTTKLDYLKNYINYTSINNPLDLVFGNLNLNMSNTNNFNNDYRISNFDSELGYLFSSIGIFGLILIVWFYRIVYKKIGKNSRFLFLILLWCLTSTILTNMRFSFIFLFVLSLYSESKLILKENEKKY